MLVNLIVVAGQVLTLFLMMAVGFVLQKIEKFSTETQTQLTFLLLYVIAPCMIIDSMQIERSAEALRSMGLAAVACLIFFVVGIIVTSLIFRK